MNYYKRAHCFKLLFSMIALLVVSNVYATGAALGSDDAFASMIVVALLTIVLGLVYLFGFINRIFKDPDYRDGIKSNFTSAYKTLIDRLKEDDREYLRFHHLNEAFKTRKYV